MAAPPTPVDVFIPPGPDPESRVFVDAADPVVTATSFLQWDAAGVVGGILRVSLPNSSMLNAFALKCRMDRSPAGLIAARPINPLTLRLTAGAWSRLLTGVRDHGLANAAPVLRDDLHEYIKAKVPLVIIMAPEWSPAPAFTLNVGAAAVRAAAARINFLGLATIAQLEITSGAAAAVAPWAAICRLAGAMGPVGTQAARLEQTALVQSVADTIKTHATGGVLDATLAANLKSNLLRANCRSRCGPEAPPPRS